MSATTSSLPQTPQTSQSRSQHPLLPFVRGGIAGVLSWLIIHPADVIKVRMQLSTTSAPTSTTNPNSPSPYRGIIHAAQHISRNEGISAMYSGLSAALTRQITYTTLRLGLYTTLRDAVSDEQGHLSIWSKFGVGIVAGGFASAVSNPVEVAMVRMYSDGAAEKATKRGYRNVGDALCRIAREEGIFGLWSGASPTIARSMIVNCVQLGTYDNAKDIYQGYGVKDGFLLHVAASMTSGFCYSVVTLPIDSAKTRLQNQRRSKDGGFKYRGLIQTMGVVAREEGVTNLWRGFMPYFSRCAGKLSADAKNLSGEAMSFECNPTCLVC